MKTPKFSVLIANYNNAHFIRETLDSVFAQTYPHWEIIIADDASTDDIRPVLNEYAADERIKIYYRDQNLGCGATKHEAAMHATGDILAYLDPEDTLRPDALEIMVKAYRENPGAVLVYSLHYQCDADLRVTGVNRSFGAIPPGANNFTADKISHFAAFKKSAYLQAGGINPQLQRAVDKDLYFKLEEAGDVVFVEEALYYYRIHPQGISSYANRDKARAWKIRVLSEAFERRKSHLSEAEKVQYQNIIRAEIKKYHKGRMRAALRGLSPADLWRGAVGYLQETRPPTA